MGRGAAPQFTVVNRGVAVLAWSLRKIAHGGSFQRVVGEKSSYALDTGHGSDEIGGV